MLKNVPNKYVVCSNYIKKELVASYGFDKRKIMNIYNPIDFQKINRELKWEPIVDFPEGIRKTIIWFLTNREWWEDFI